MLILLSGFAVCATSQKAECARCRSAVRVRTRGMSKKEKRARSNRRNNDSKFPRNPRRSRKVAELRKDTRDCDSETTSQCDHGRIATAKCGPRARKRAASKATWRIKQASRNFSRLLAFGGPGRTELSGLCTPGTVMLSVPWYNLHCKTN